MPGGAGSASGREDVVKTENMLSFLADLEMHNELNWMHANKQRYLDARANFEELLQRLILRVGETDSSVVFCSPRDITFRLNRDTRFGYDRSPYNPSFRAHISSAGKKPIPCGYFLKIQPCGRSVLGGGLFTDMLRDATGQVRDYIAGHGGELREIIEEPSFTGLLDVRGVRLKNVPRGYDAGHPQAEYLKNKSWYVEYPVPDEGLLDADRFVETAADVFAHMKPFNDYLNRALEGFVLPEWC